jgi:GNAT superfamily N-acetyltransferase
LLEFKKALIEDLPKLVKVAISSFAEDKIKYGSMPPGVDEESQHNTYLNEAEYFKIIKDSIIIGGIIVFKGNDGGYTLGSIFIEPKFQNQGIGKESIMFIESYFKDAKKWSLDTPYLSFRNHHFYEKMGYIKKGETNPEANSKFYLFLYEKIIKN